MSGGDAETLLVLAPRGRDGPLASSFLVGAGFDARVCRSLDELVRQLGQPVGAVLIAEEALVGDVAGLDAVLARQPPWSDLPFIVFAAAGRVTAANPAVTRLGNVALLERPLVQRAFLAAVGAALRGRRRQYEARHAIEQRDEFLAMLGHELRNPLGAMSLAIELLALDGASASVDVLRRQSTHLARLVDDLLDVARVTSGKIVLRKEPIDLCAVVARVVESQRAPALASGLTLRHRDAGAVIVVDGDVVRLEQVFTNLLTNAIKYTAAGGTIDVGVSVDDGVARVDVSDDGVGIEPAMLPWVFDLFVQVPGSIARARGGLGIGLTVVKNLIAQHGGSVDVKSDGVGHGSCFTVALPVSAMSLPQAAPVVRERHIDGARSVVIVDDSDDLRESLSALLRQVGYDVSSAADGITGLSSIVDRRPAVALVDLGLPGIDGYEVARRARSALGHTVRLYAISGYGQPADKAAARAAGFDRHFTKPIDVAQLLSLLDDKVATAVAP